MYKKLLSLNREKKNRAKQQITYIQYTHTCTHTYTQNTLILKMHKGSEQTFFQRKHGQQIHKPVHDIANYQENANQNHKDIYHLKTIRMAIIKKTKDVLERM